MKSCSTRGIGQVLDLVERDPVGLVEIVIAQQRHIGFRPLAAAGLGVDVGGDAPEQLFDFEAGLLEPLQERGW